MTQRIVIAGAGHAAGQVVATLRHEKFDGQIVLVGNEKYLPYQRPPLSKKFLAGELPPERLYFKPQSFYEQPNVELHLSTRISAINSGAHTVETSAGEAIHYDKLVLATGSRARRLGVDGADLKGVHYLRSIEDVNAIRRDIEKADSVVIVGAGYIGLEVAAVLRKLGLTVTVLEMADRVMSRVVSPPVSEFFQAKHVAEGVNLVLSSGLSAFLGSERIKAVQTSDGRKIPADVVVVGIGIEPNTELAASAGLEVDNGIVVDERCRTSHPDIYAVGDCTLHPNNIYGRRVRLESVHNALEQAKTAASNLCDNDIRYHQVPWFWSDQYDLKLQIAGLSEGYDDIVMRGDPASGSFSCLYLRDGRLIACDAVNAPKDFMPSKTLIADRLASDRNRLADPALELKSLIVR